jgi:transcription initiation factor TFIID subunit 6
MPSILTCLVAKRLGDPNRSTPKETYALRDFASSLLSLVLKRFSTSYSTLKPRITRALLKAFLDNKKPFTTHYGAIIGLTVMGREVVRTLVVPNLKIYSEHLLQPALSDDGDIAQRNDAEKSLEAIMVFSLYDWSDELESLEYSG